MNLGQFFSLLSSHPDWCNQYPITHFKGNQTYPLLFFSLLFTHFKNTSSLMIQTIDVGQEDTVTILAKLETTFLGMSTLYWLKNITDLDEKKRTYWLNYVQSYAGPNHILFFTNNATALSSKVHHEILIGDVIDQKTFIELISFFYPNAAMPTTTIARIFKGRDAIALDTACVLMQYVQLLGANSDLFITQWLDKIIMPEQSLFTLSTSFFAKKPEPFFKQWATISGDFADVFWVSFWSEQLWRAYHFVILTKSKQFAEAKKIGMRLPFTFIQRDWKLHTPQSLLAAHHHMYAIDCALKNSGSSIALDAFYSKFFSQK